VNMTKILPTETEIIGEWVVESGRTVESVEAKRIEKLISSYLEEVAVSADGWSKLLRDPSDGRLWELTYPSSSSHGGGAPTLVCLSPYEAAAKFNA